MNTHGVILGKIPVQFSHLLAHALYIIMFLISSFCKTQKKFSIDSFFIITLGLLTLVNPLNHCFLCSWPVHGQIQQSHSACKRKRCCISSRPDERVRTVGNMSSCREENEERLNAKVGGEHFFLQGGKGGYRQCIVADFGHNETLGPCELLLSHHDLQSISRPTKTHLVELGAEQSAVDQQVIWSGVCKLSQSTDETTVESHFEFIQQFTSINEWKKIEGRNRRGLRGQRWLPKMLETKNWVLVRK